MNNKEMRREVCVYAHDVNRSFILGDPSRRTKTSGDSLGGLVSLSLVDGVLDFGKAGCVAVSDVQELLHDIQQYLRSQSSPIEARTFLDHVGGAIIVLAGLALPRWILRRGTGGDAKAGEEAVPC